jgi:hypothetical protein
MDYAVTNMEKLLELEKVDDNGALFTSHDVSEEYKALLPKESWVDMGCPLIITLTIPFGHLHGDRKKWVDSKRL